MNGHNINLKSSSSRLFKMRFIWVFLIVILALILIPSGIALANNDEAKQASNDSNEITISGKISTYQEFGTFTPIVSVVGWDENGNFYKGNTTNVGADGNYTLNNIPNNVTGLIEVVRDQSKTGFKVLPHESKTGVDFYLPRGATGPFNDSNDLDYYIIKAGSTYTDEDGATLIFNKDLNLIKDGKKYLPDKLFCFADDSHLIPDHTKGYLTYKYESQKTPENINVTITCAGKNGKYFTNFIIKDRVRQYDYHVHQSNSNVPIYPVFTSENTMVVTGNLRELSPGTEEILNHDPYVYAIWYDWTTNKIGLKYATIAQPDANAGGNYGIQDVPINAVGAVVGGASGYAMDVGSFFYWDDDHPETHAPNLNVPYGAKFNIQCGEGFENVVLAKGTTIWFNGGLEPDEPYTLEEDIDLGNEFPPFGLLLDTKITFNADGTATYVYQPEHPEEHEITHANFIFKAVPKAGYSFGAWKVNNVETSGEYTVSSKDNVIVEPVFSAPSVPSETAQTGDSTYKTIFTILFVIALSSGIMLRRKLFIK